MTLSQLPLSYCTNVHPGRSLAEVDSGLTQYTTPLRESFGHPLAAGLWLAQPVIEELLDEDGAVDRFAKRLADRGLTCHTLNAFPYGDFHSERVKEKVYLPDWSEASRHRYTLDCAKVLSGLLPEGTAGSISTVPLGFKEFEHPADFADRCALQLLDVAEGLSQLEAETGKKVRLAIEPEPFCVLETTAETLQFFQRLREHAADRNQLETVNEYLGVCYDVCHQSVEFEDVPQSIAALRDANIRINKVHITCAIQLANPGEDQAAREALANYVEPRYLHQTMARTSDGKVHRFVDLNSEFALTPESPFAEADMWRVHFHVPVNAEQLGPLQTTRDDLKAALQAIPALDYAPHLEVETYTWEVLPGEAKPNLVEGLTKELLATRELLALVE